MKHFFQFTMCIIGITLCFSSNVVAKNLQPFYFDNPNANVQRLVEMTDEQAAFFADYERAWQQVEAGADMAAFFVVERAEDPSDSVSHLLQDIMYDQERPYNNLCPLINGRRALTGCVATAMAQIMRYYAYPANGTGEVTYSGGDDGAKTIDLEDYTFDWNLILNNYNIDYTSAQGEAVAKLMLACGASLNMNYSADGSGSHLNKAMKAFKDNFGFSKDIEYYDSSNDYDPEGLIEYDWVYTIRDNHQKGHPVMYAGSPADGMSGHAFVIDGYKVIDDTYYYHVNWGWSGAYNGYYLIMNLKPTDENYAGYGCDMVVNIYPVGSDVENVETPTKQIDPSKPIYTILGTIIPYEQLQRGNIYVQQGKKFIY